MSELDELRRHGARVVEAWERLGQCEDEFAPDGDPPACNEWRDALDTAIIRLSTALADHAFVATGSSGSGSVSDSGGAPRLSE